MSDIADRIEYRVNAELGGDADVKHVVAMVLEEPPYCAVNDLLAALKEIAKGEGRFSRDPLEHAANTIEDMKALALAAIERAEGR